MAEEADRRVQRTVNEVVAERFERERPSLGPLPAQRYDTSYLEIRQVGWDAYIDVRGNRYSVPAEWAGQTVTVRIGLDGDRQVYAQERLIARRRLQSAQKGWVTVPEHHAALWEEVHVEQRPLEVYQEAIEWNWPPCYTS